ncbi:hypothetical protein AAMO2058_001748500, partial [Amorphochlora amoebiformis]
MPASRKVAMGTVLWLLGGYVSDFRASPRTHQGRNRSKKTFLSSKVEEIGPLAWLRGGNIEELGQILGEVEEARRDMRETEFGRLFHQPNTEGPTGKAQGGSEHTDLGKPATENNQEWMKDIVDLARKIQENKQNNQDEKKRSSIETGSDGFYAYQSRDDLEIKMPLMDSVTKHDIEVKFRPMRFEVLVHGQITQGYDLYARTIPEDASWTCENEADGETILTIYLEKERKYIWPTLGVRSSSGAKLDDPFQYTPRNVPKIAQIEPGHVGTSETHRV